MATTRGQGNPDDDATPVRVRLGEVAREVIGGDKRAAIRRTLLYALVVGLILACLVVDGKGGVIFGGLAIIVLLILGFSDQLV